MGIQARQLARFARKNEIEVRRFGYSIAESKNLGHCVLGVLSHMIGESCERVEYGGPVVIAGLTSDQRKQLEAGFEGWKKEPGDGIYYKVGQNFARLMGLSPKS
jgi:hypothetical protein